MTLLTTKCYSLSNPCIALSKMKALYLEDNNVDSQKNFSRLGGSEDKLSILADQKCVNDCTGNKNV